MCCVLRYYHAGRSTSFHQLSDLCGHLQDTQSPRIKPTNILCSSIQHCHFSLTTRCSEDSDDDDYIEVGDTDSKHIRRHKRCLLSTSLDVDPRLPYRSELKGFPPGLDSHRIGIPKSNTAEDHQTILLTSMVMGMGEGREGKVRQQYILLILICVLVLW